MQTVSMERKDNDHRSLIYCGRKKVNDKLMRTQRGVLHGDGNAGRGYSIQSYINTTFVKFYALLNVLNN